MLSLLHHPNLVNLIGYCADGDQRLLVYEYMPLGSLEDHLHGMDCTTLYFHTKMYCTFAGMCQKHLTAQSTYMFTLNASYN